MKNTVNKMKELIYSNNGFETIKEAYNYLSDKYGKVVVAGGSMTDLLYKKDFYDIDVFIKYSDLKSEWQDQISASRLNKKLVEVFRDSYLGIDIDIVVIGIDIKNYINRFDMNIKRIWYDGNLHIAKQAAKDFYTNSVSLNNYENENAWFRLYRTALKYDISISKADEFIVANHLSALKTIKVSQKYEQYLDIFKPIDRVNVRLAYLTAKYMNHNYESKSSFKFIDFRLFKLAVSPYLKARKVC